MGKEIIYPAALKQAMDKVEKKGTSPMEDRVTLALLAGYHIGRNFTLREMLEDIKTEGVDLADYQNINWEQCWHYINRLEAKIKARLDTD